MADRGIYPEKTKGRPERVPVFAMGAAAGMIRIKDMVLEEL
jgi:hypothetical protein